MSPELISEGFAEIYRIAQRALYSEHSWRIAWLFIASLVIVGMWGKKQLKPVFVIPTAVMMLVIYSLPVGILSVQGGPVGERIMPYGSRFPQLFPVVIVAAYAAYLLLERLPDKGWQKTASALMVICLIVFMGQCAFAPDGLGEDTSLGAAELFGGWNIPANPEKIDPETVEIADRLLKLEADNDKEIFVRCPAQIGEDIRIYDERFRIKRRHGDKQKLFDIKKYGYLIGTSRHWCRGNPMYIVYPHDEKNFERIKEKFLKKECPYVFSTESGAFDVFHDEKKRK